MVQDSATSSECDPLTLGCSRPIHGDCAPDRKVCWLTPCCQHIGSIPNQQQRALPSDWTLDFEHLRLYARLLQRGGFHPAATDLGLQAQGVCGQDLNHPAPLDLGSCLDLLMQCSAGNSLVYASHSAALFDLPLRTPPLDQQLLGLLLRSIQDRAQGQRPQQPGCTFPWRP